MIKFNDPRLSETLSALKGGLECAIVQKIVDQNKVILRLVNRSIETPPARVISSFLGEKSGSVIIPKPGQEVLVGFLNGELRDPVIIGCLYNSKYKPPFPVNKDKNDIMHISLPGGTVLQINSADNEQIITLTTQKKHEITLDDKNEFITFYGKGNKTGLKMDLKNGEIEIIAEKKISFTAGTNDKIVLENGKGLSFESGSGDLKTKSTNVEMQSQANFKIKANANFEATASAKGKISGQAGVECSSSAIATFKGNPLMLN